MFKVAVLSLLVSLTGCSEGSYNEIALMPSPVVFASGTFDPFPDDNLSVLDERTALFYVTDRAVATADDNTPRYANRRGQLARAGVAQVALNPGVDDWQDLRDITLLGKRQTDYFLEVTEADEFGVLPYSATALFPDPPSRAEMDSAGKEFASAINAQLRKSDVRDVFIYVHGYNVDFEYSTLVSKELQHFLGYQGAFISYNWAATPNRFAYLKDQETASATRRNLRSLIEFVSQNTDAERINLIGYSAGSRLTFEVTYQIALQKNNATTPRLGNVMLISSDLDRSNFGHALADGLLDAVDRMTLYLSGTDAALAMSSFVFGRDRLGQTFEDGDVWPELEETLASLTKLEMIDVSAAESSDLGNGHWYFQSSPWASSDLFISALTDLPAGKRGLVRQDGKSLWTFPGDYPSRINNIKAP